MRGMCELRDGVWIHRARRITLCSTSRNGRDPHVDGLPNALGICGGMVSLRVDASEA